VSVAVSVSVSVAVRVSGERRAQLTFISGWTSASAISGPKRSSTWAIGSSRSIELEREPAQIEALYKVALRRLEPVGLQCGCPVATSVLRP
jgi:hypothetical protein